MRTLISALIILVLVVVLISLLNEGNGYALFGYGQWTVEGSLALFILLDLALFLLLFLAIRTLARIWSMPERWQNWKKNRQEKRAHNALINGLLDIASGKWKSAEQKLIKYVEISDKPLLNYLGAARTAQQQGTFNKRDRYLQLAQESAPSEELAVSLTQAELQLSTDQMEQALATLLHLRSIAPKHGYVLKLLKDLYLRMEDWGALKQLLGQLYKSDAITRDEVKDLEVQTYVGLMRNASDSEDTKELDEVWRQTPKHLRDQAQIVLIYAQHFMDKGEHKKAELMLEEAIANSWDEGLVELYGLVEGGNSTRQLNQAESWLEAHQHSPALLLALAHICLRDKLWGKARTYLETSIGVSPSAEAYQELGILLEQMGEKELALDNYRAGLELSSKGPESRSWEYDGRKAQDDLDLASPSDLRQPMDAPMPATGDTTS